LTQPIDPATFAAIQQFLAQQQAPQIPQQPQYGQVPQYPQQHMPVQPAVPVTQPVEVSLADAYEQANRVVGAGLFKGSGGPDGEGDPIGTSFTCVVRGKATAQQIVNYDTKQPEFYKDGRPKAQILVPFAVTPSERHPEGEAVHYVKGLEIAEMNRAMEAAGCTRDEILQGPEVGAVVKITYSGKKRLGNGQGFPAKIRTWEYFRPQTGGQTASAVPAQPAPPPSPAPVTPAPQVATPAPAQPAPSVPQFEGLDPAAAALLAKLTNQQAG
jgi:hypothetical protein